MHTPTVDSLCTARQNAKPALVSRLGDLGVGPRSHPGGCTRRSRCWCYGYACTGTLCKLVARVGKQTRQKTLFVQAVVVTFGKVVSLYLP